LFLGRLDRGSLMEDPVVHIWGLSMLAYILLPSLIRFPNYSYPLAFMQYRVSLFIAILFCAMVAARQHGRNLALVSSLLAAVFFAMMYLDARALNHVEAELTRLVSELPPNARVASALQDSASRRINGLVHAGSSACLGRCWDYGNYEPSSAAFRVRVSGPNGVVAGDVRTVIEIEEGQHLVTSEEAPLYSVCPAKESGAQFELRRLEAGEVTCLVSLPATNHF
jgi:hypothetical protein